MSFLLATCVFSLFVSTIVLTTPSVASAQEEEQKPAPDVAKSRTNPIIHFFVSIGVLFGLLFAAISVGMVALIILLLLDHLARPVVNSFPLGLLFLAWPTAFMMWMVSPDWLGVGIAAASVAANSLLYVGAGRLLLALRNRTIRRLT